MGQYKNDVVLLDKSGNKSVFFYYEPEDARAPIYYDYNGKVAKAPAAAAFAANYYSFSFFQDGSVEQIEIHNADKSDVILTFADTAGTANGSVAIGESKVTFGKLVAYDYVAAHQVDADGGSAPCFELHEKYADGHLTSYQLNSLTAAGTAASLLATYALNTQAASIKIDLPGSATDYAYSGKGQIDALVHLNASQFIDNNAADLTNTGNNAFTALGANGSGLVGNGSAMSVVDVNGNKTAVISNDGAGLDQLAALSMISQDGGGIISHDGGGLIGNDGGGLLSTAQGALVAAGGGNLVAAGGGNLTGNRSLLMVESAQAASNSDPYRDLNGASAFGSAAVDLFDGSSNAIADAPRSSWADKTYLGIVLDTLSAIAMGSGTKDLLAQGSSDPVDLTITTAFLDRPKATLGETINVSWQVKNNGTGVADPSHSYVWLSKDTKLDASDTLMASVADPYLLSKNASSDTADYKLPTNLTPGTYYVIVNANGDGHAVENGTNNQSTPLALTVTSAQTRPDLAPTTILLNNSSTSPASGMAGGTVNVSYGIKESNQVAAGATTSKIYLSTDSTITADDTLLGSLPEAALQAGKTVISGGDFKLADDLATGTYYIGVIADANGAVDETNETNNASAGYAIHVTGKSGPDLRVENMSVADSQVNPGDLAYVSFDVVNTGTSIVRNSTTNLYLSKDATLSSDDTLLRSDPEYPVIPGSDNTKTRVDVQIDSSVKTGTYYVIAASDAGHTVTEVSETNNNAAVQLDVVAPKPDLSFDSNISVTKTTVAAGASDAFQFYVTNNSTKGSAAPAHGRIYLSTDATIDDSDTVITGFTTPTLGTSSDGTPPDYVYEDIAFTLPKTLKPGTYYIGAAADFDNYVDETDETNNASGAVKITVTAAVPDPTITLGKIAGDGIVNKAEAAAGVTVVGTTGYVEDGRTITLSLKTTSGTVLGTKAVTVSHGAFSATMPGFAAPHGLTSGNLVVTADVSNAAGTAAPQASETVAYDFVPPAVSLTTDTLHFNSKKGYDLTLAGKVDSGDAHVHVLDGAVDLGEAAIDASGHWSFAHHFALGAHKVSLEATDPAGNATVSAIAPFGGAHTFVFSSVGGKPSVDQFSSIEHDRINLRAIDAETELHGRQKFHFIANKAFHHYAADDDPADHPYGELQAVYSAKSDTTVVRGEVNHDGKTDFMILVHGDAYHKGDFLL